MGAIKRVESEMSYDYFEPEKELTPDNLDGPVCVGEFAYCCSRCKVDDEERYKKPVLRSRHV
jgi:diphthamide synthase subunit DPH2